MLVIIQFPSWRTHKKWCNKIWCFSCVWVSLKVRCVRFHLSLLGGIDNWHWVTPIKGYCDTSISFSIFTSVYIRPFAIRINIYSWSLIIGRSSQHPYPKGMKNTHIWVVSTQLNWVFQPSNAINFFLSFPIQRQIMHLIHLIKTLLPTWK